MNEELGDRTEEEGHLDMGPCSQAIHSRLLLSYQVHGLSEDRASEIIMLHPGWIRFWKPHVKVDCAAAHALLHLFLGILANDNLSQEGLLSTLPILLTIHKVSDSVNHLYHILSLLQSLST